MSEQWKIHQLQQIAALALKNGESAEQPSARIRDVPDTRTIRYYTTLGLLNRPSEMRGRTAYYDRRHVAQLVAIKRLQQSGLSLAQIQEKLVGSSRAVVNRIADIPTDFWKQDFHRKFDKQQPAKKVEARQRKRESSQRKPNTTEQETPFWAVAVALPDEASRSDVSKEAPTSKRNQAKIAVRVPVADGVVLEIDSRHLMSLDQVDFNSLQPYLTSLANELKRQGISNQ